MKTTFLHQPDVTSSAPLSTARLWARAVIDASHAKTLIAVIGSIRLLAGKEFGDRVRSGWVLACILVWLGAIGLTSFLGLVQIGRVGVQGYDRTVISMLNLVQYLVPLLGLLLGHDLIVGENEERTCRLLVASGLSRFRLLLSKFFGGCVTVALPLLAGFVISGAVIGVAAKDTGTPPFLRLAFSGMALGVIFLAIGLALSCFCKTRVQAIVAALLTWCVFVFAFDLVALGAIVSFDSAAAAREIELVCDPMHINPAADIHSEADTVSPMPVQQLSTKPAVHIAAVACLAVNPVDLFRAVNLSSTLGVRVPFIVVVGSFFGWLALALLLGRWRLSKTDL
jgi:Cu-processing system permease protein